MSSSSEPNQVPAEGYDSQADKPSREEMRRRNREEKERRRALGKERIDALNASERLNEEDFAIRINARG